MKKDQKKRKGGDDDKKKQGQVEEPIVGSGDYNLPEDIGAKIGANDPMQSGDLR